MTKTIEEFEKNQAREREKFQAELSIRAELPAAMREKASICIHGDHASVSWREYGAFANQKLVNAVAILRQIQDKLVEGEHWKDGCLSTYPPEINVTAKGKNATMDGAHAVEFKVEGGRGFGPNVTLRFWAKLDSGLVEIAIGVSDLWKLVPSVHNTYYQGEVSKSEVTWPVESRCVDSFRKWWSSPGNYSGSYYFADLPNFDAWLSNELTGENAQEAPLRG